MSELRERPVLDLLQELRLLGEHERIEAKRAGSIGHSIMETVCAFANEPNLGGGVLLLGVEEPDQLSLFQSYGVVGVKNPDKIQNDFLSQCRDIFNVPVTVRITPEIVEGRHLIKVFVPEAPVSSKPIYFKSEGLPGGALRRSGAGDVRCTEDDLLVFYEGRSVETFDAGIVAQAEMSDIDPDAVQDYRRERERANAEAEELGYSDIDMLHALDCVRKVEGGYRPTVAGILLFGSKIALRRLFPMMRVDYIRVPGKEWVADPDSRFDTIEIREPLLRAVRRAQAAIWDDLPESFSLPEGQMQREGHRVIPARVIREAVVNALMHRSYRKQSPMQIIRYANRLEIHNPGYSLKNEEHLGEPGSLPRNPKLASVLHDTLFAETKGSGVRAMRDLMQRADLTPPLFESEREKDKFVAVFSFHHFLSEADWLWLATYKEFGISNEEARALVWVRENGAITNAVYRNLNVVDTLNASTHLRRLRDCELLIQKGKSTATFYLPGPKFLASSPRIEPQPGRAGDLSGELGAQSREVEPQSEGGGAQSREVEPQSKGPDSQSREAGVVDAEPPSVTLKPTRDKLLDSLAPDVRHEVTSFEGRPGVEATRSLIVRLCRVRAWRLEELALVLGRTPAHLRDFYLSPMVREGLLERTYPHMPSHPLQAYLAAGELPS